MTTQKQTQPAGIAGHTPTPYRVGINDEFNGLCILSEFGRVAQLCLTEEIDAEAQETAALIVEAVNSHAQLLAQNQALREALEIFADLCEPRELFPNACESARALLSPK